MRHPCTHAKSISFSIFASKTAVTSPATKLRTYVKITCTCIFASKTFGSSPCPVGGGAHRWGWSRAPARAPVGGARDRRGARGGGPAG